ncbi:MAG: type ISP restriction/modification enzyme [Candidatus Dechloromonas phosphoritropha]
MCSITTVDHRDCVWSTRQPGSPTFPPHAAWQYRLGNHPALEWVLDQYQESAPRDPTIREKFNTYSFADYKEKVIDLLGCVCAASVETQGIIEKMNTYPLQGEVAHEHNG